MTDLNSVVGSHDVLLLVFDCLRYDAAIDCLAAGKTPNLARLLPDGWELRHAPGSFTLASHQAFFAGFLPTPAAPGKHPRPFAVRFQGSETTGPETCVFDAPDVVHGLAARGYRTVCIGGVGFFNKQNPLGSVLPGYFQESHWSPELGVTCPESTENQVALARGILDGLPKDQRVFLCVNLSAIHQPNRFYLPGATEDSLVSHGAALQYVDRCLPPLFEALQRRGPSFCILCSDHGEAYGEEGFQGHRLAHPVIWNVPYAEFVLPAREKPSTIPAPCPLQ